MAKRRSAAQGDKVENSDEPALDPANGVQAAANEFAPTIINNGDGTNEEAQPAPSPAASMIEESPPENEAAAADDASPSIVEEDFLDYVNNVLKPEADKLGFDLVLKKRGNQRGPVMLYDPSTREGKVYSSRDEAPAHFLTGDQLNAIREEEVAHARLQG